MQRARCCQEQIISLTWLTFTRSSVHTEQNLSELCLVEPEELPEFVIIQAQLSHEGVIGPKLRVSLPQLVHSVPVPADGLSLSSLSSGPFFFLFFLGQFILLQQIHFYHFRHIHPGLKVI